MNGYSGTLAPPGGMYVRALYDYETDDHTSLSFRQGDIIQVITQLESGWWDGVINGVNRGWFPSNYCAVIPRPSPDGRSESQGTEGEMTDEDASQEDYSSEQDYEDAETETNGVEGSGRYDDFAGEQDEAAAFWIPQATPDGRLFYFNTLTGVSTMHLPLENANGANDSRPRDWTNPSMPATTHGRLPPELMQQGAQTDDDTDFENSASETELSNPRNTMGWMHSPFNHGPSPATSMDSISRETGSNVSLGQGHVLPNRAESTSFVPSSLSAPVTAAMSRKFFDDQHAVPLTWSKLVADMSRSVERYRQSINNCDRSEFVKRAEDISDHLRLLLAAGSGTTDNHSGNPSIISSNKALYPHFRETMSRFSKLVLSSHIAASDWPPPDSYVKCLKEADGVLHGVQGFVDVAKGQRGEEIPRLIPGFVVGSRSGGSWQNNGLGSRDPLSSMSFIEQDDFEPYEEPTAILDEKLLGTMEERRKVIAGSVRRLEEQLVVQDRLITPRRHHLLSELVCQSAGKVLEYYRPWLATVESINLEPLATEAHPQVNDFSVHKQRVYDLVAELIIACQAVAAPLADEWSDTRKDSLDDRLGAVREVAQNLNAATSELYYSMQLLTDRPGEVQPANGKMKKPSISEPVPTGKLPMRPRLDDLAQFNSSQDSNLLAATLGHGNVPNQDNEKAWRVLGNPLVRENTVPDFLRLEHENEVQFDVKHTPPHIKGGTLTGLVEQLTRHDKLDADFNKTFLLTYRSFTTASDLFEMLVKRWSIQPPFGLSKEDYQTWVEKKQKFIRVRVVNILKSWFDHYWMEGQDDEAKALIQRVYSFAKDHVAPTSSGAQGLMKSVDERSRGQDARSKNMVMTPATNAPAPILPKHMKRLKFLDIDVVEFARQLTIIESRLYCRIKSSECLSKTWNKKLSPGENDPAPNIKAFILHSNQLTNWVAQMILTQQDVKRRVVVIKHFVSIADKCRNLSNFATLTSILSALDSAPIHRLSRTWAAVHSRTIATLESIRKLMGRTKNFLEYRDMLHRATPPCIPFFGVYLTDLTFIEDGIQSMLPKTNLINFAKRTKTAEVIRDIQAYQDVPYSLQAVPELQEYILTNSRSAGDVHEMYELSLTMEPREREDEKIARLLSESGFL